MRAVDKMRVKHARERQRGALHARAVHVRCSTNLSGLGLETNDSAALFSDKRIKKADKRPATYSHTDRLYLEVHLNI